MFRCGQLVQLKVPKVMGAMDGSRRIYRAGERGVVTMVDEVLCKLTVLFSYDLDELKQEIEGDAIGAFEDGSFSVDLGLEDLSMDWFEPVYDEEYLRLVKARKA